jgi:transcriptional regulator with XRE-family HTH domain
MLAANLVALRNERGWSQEVLAFEAGLHRTFIAHVERQARNISLDNIEKIARALEVPCCRLLISECVTASAIKEGHRLEG